MVIGIRRESVIGLRENAQSAVNGHLEPMNRLAERLLAVIEEALQSTGVSRRQGAASSWISGRTSMRG